MRNLEIYSEINKGKHCLIKEIDSYEKFKDVIGVFKNPPYNEILTEEDCRKEYESYIYNGYMFGCFINDEIAGINCILNDVPSDYSICFSDKSRIAYYSGLAVKSQFRRLGLGKLLVNETEKYLESQDKYDSSFARILCEGSMSEGIFRLNGFMDAYYNNTLITDDVSYERNTGVVQSDKRKYMVKRISNRPNEYTKR